MSEKVAIAYIGKKPFKKDTITNSRLVFPRHKAVEVDSEIAYQLLGYPTVWVLGSELTDHIKISEQQEQEDARQKAEQEAAEKAAAEQASMEVTLAGEVIDLAKLNSAKLNTLIVANELDTPKKGAQEDVETFRIRLRDFIRNLSADSEE